MKEVLSNIAGNVMTCSVQVGDQIEVGDTVAVIESMKMEIPAESEESGKVVEVCVAVGDEVEEGQRLVILA